MFCCTFCWLSREKSKATMHGKHWPHAPSLHGSMPQTNHGFACVNQRQKSCQCIVFFQGWTQLLQLLTSCLMSWSLASTLVQMTKFCLCLKSTSYLSRISSSRYSCKGHCLCTQVLMWTHCTSAVCNSLQMTNSRISCKLKGPHLKLKSHPNNGIWGEGLCQLWHKMQGIGICPSHCFHGSQGKQCWQNFFAMPLLFHYSTNPFLDATPSWLECGQCLSMVVQLIWLGETPVDALVNLLAGLTFPPFGFMLNMDAQLPVMNQEPGNESHELSPLRDVTLTYDIFQVHATHCPQLWYHAPANIVYSHWMERITDRQTVSQTDKHTHNLSSVTLKILLLPLALSQPTHIITHPV